MSAPRRAGAAAILVLAFLWDLIVSSLRVAVIVLRPGPATRPAMLVMDTDIARPWGIALLAYLTSLTPGSTCLHVEGRRLYLHVLDAPDPAATLARFRRLYEAPVRVLAA